VVPGPRIHRLRVGDRRIHLDASIRRSDSVGTERNVMDRHAATHEVDERE
jgi:hypothetical protein